MGKKRRGHRGPEQGDEKRARISTTDVQRASGLVSAAAIDQSSLFEITARDKVEQKVDIIVRDIANNCHRSLTIYGSGLSVEKTIAVVEELKRTYTKHGTRYTQETAIKSGDDGQPYLQVILTLLESMTPDVT